MPYLSDGVGDAIVGDLSGSWAVRGVGSHDLGGVRGSSTVGNGVVGGSTCSEGSGGE